MGWLGQGEPVDLSPAEWQRGERLTDVTARLRWLRARSLVRQWLGRTLDLEPGAVILPVQGPLCLDPGQNPLGLHVSLSHGGEWLVVAVAREPVGVDIEPWREVGRVDALARRFLAADAAMVVTSVGEPEKSRRFLRLWTGVESLVKASGVSLYSLLDRVSWREGLPHCLTVDVTLASWQVVLQGEEGPCCLALCLPRHVASDYFTNSTPLRK